MWFAPDGNSVCASLSGEDAVAKVDVKTRGHVGKVTEDAPGTTVSVIDTATFTITAEVEAGAGAHGIVVDPASRHAYVTNLYADTVAVLDLETLSVVATMPVGSTPNGINFSPVTMNEPPASTAVDLPVFGAESGDAHTDGEGHDAH